MWKFLIIFLFVLSSYSFADLKRLNEEDIVVGGDVAEGIRIGGTVKSRQFYTRNVNGVEKKFYDGSTEFKQIKQTIEKEAMSFLIKSYGNIAADGTYTRKVPNKAYEDYFNITRKT